MTCGKQRNSSAQNRVFFGLSPTVRFFFFFVLPFSFSVFEKLFYVIYVLLVFVFSFRCFFLLFLSHFRCFLFRVVFHVFVFPGCCLLSCVFSFFLSLFFRCGSPCRLSFLFFSSFYLRDKYGCFISAVCRSLFHTPPLPPSRKGSVVNGQMTKASNK